jgi:hypothetical protein
MKLNIPKILTMAALPAMLLFAATAQAQIGGGWSQFSLNGDFIDYEVSDVHYQHSVSSFGLPSMYYTNSGSSETFGLVTSGSNRVEHDSNSHYTSGSRQFEGYLQIFSGISEQSCVQIFDGTASGPILMIKGYGSNNGTLEKQGGSVVLATGCFGQTERINIIHDLNANTLTVYLNGTQAWTGSGGLGDSFNVKYGLYGSFNSSTKTIWSNVKFFQGGNQGSGYYQIQDRNSGKDATVEYAATTNGAPVILYTFGSGQNDQWKLTPTDSGYYQIVNRKSGLDLAVQGASTAAGAKVIQWSFGSGQNDQWQPVSVGGGYYKFVNRHSGLVLDVTGAGTSNGTPFEQWNDTGGNNQQFQMITTP